MPVLSPLSSGARYHSVPAQSLNVQKGDHQESETIQNHAIEHTLYHVWEHLIVPLSTTQKSWGSMETGKTLYQLWVLIINVNMAPEHNAGRTEKLRCTEVWHVCNECCTQPFHSGFAAWIQLDITTQFHIIYSSDNSLCITIVHAIEWFSCINKSKHNNKLWYVY